MDAVAGELPSVVEEIEHLRMQLLRKVLLAKIAESGARPDAVREGAAEASGRVAGAAEAKGDAKPTGWGSSALSAKHGVPPSLCQLSAEDCRPEGPSLLRSPMLAGCRRAEELEDGFQERAVPWFAASEGSEGGLEPAGAPATDRGMALGAHSSRGVAGEIDGAATVGDPVGGRGHGPTKPVGRSDDSGSGAGDSRPRLTAAGTPSAMFVKELEVGQRQPTKPDGIGPEAQDVCMCGESGVGPARGRGVNERQSKVEVPPGPGSHRAAAVRRCAASIVLETPMVPAL